MFEMLRKMILPIIVIVLFFFIAMIVLQWGLDITRRDQGGVQANVAGTVNGEEISWQAFSQTYQNILQNERNTRGADYEIPEDRARQLEQQAWDQLVTDRLIKQESERLNVVVSDEDVYQYLKYSPPQYMQQAPELQTNGQFDYQKYLSLMTDPQAAPLWANLEPLVREDLKRIKVQQVIMEAAHVAEAEVKQAFMDRRETVTVGVVNAQLSQFFSTIPDIADETLQTYFDEHRDDYPVGEQVVLEIVKIIKEASAFDEEAAKARAQEVYDSVTTGSDFVEFAQIYSDDPGSGAGGGDLGWFSRGKMVAAFDSVAFEMAEGDISLPIKTDFGWHVLKHHGYRDADTIREAHVSHILIKTQASAETLETAWQQLDMILSQSDDLGYTAAAEAEGLEVYTTDPIEQGGYISWIGAGGPALEWAFENEVGTISEVMDMPNVYCVLRISERMPAGHASFEQIKQQVKRDYRNLKLAEICRDTIQLVYDDIHNGSSVADAAKKYSLTYEELAPFSRDATVAKLGSDPVVIGTAFSLDQGAISGPLDYTNGTAILELLSTVSPDLTEYNEKRDSVYEALMTSKQQQAYSAWYSQLIDNAEIRSNVSFYSRR
jgi:peptidyl-prolyl cis-trans isomerase D